MGIKEFLGEGTALDIVNDPDRIVYETEVRNRTSGDDIYRVRYIRREDYGPKN